MKKIPPEQAKPILMLLKKRFEENENRHTDLEWPEIENKLKANLDKLWSISQMEISGGEPDVIGYNKESNEYIFCDCSDETPKGRRNVCYDREGLESRKEHKPEKNAIDMADEMGIDMLTEEQYIKLQEIGEFDTKTSSWIKTPAELRVLGGALFGDRRYNRVFIYHNSAPSYYGVRGFRGLIRV